MRRSQVLTLAFGVMLATRLGARPAEPVLTVLVADRVGIGEETVRRATHVSEQILAAAGIPTEFASCPVIPSGPNFRFAWPSKIGRISVYLSIMAKPLPGHKVEAASAALALSGMPGELGSHIYVYYERVSEAARSGNCTEFRILGHVIAHEIGHLLGLRHSSGAIMCPNWNSRAVREMSATHLLFNPDEVQTLRHNIRKWLTLGKSSEPHAGHAR